MKSTCSVCKSLISCFADWLVLLTSLVRIPDNESRAACWFRSIRNSLTLFAKLYARLRSGAWSSTIIIQQRLIPSSLRIRFFKASRWRVRAPYVGKLTVGAILQASSTRRAIFPSLFLNNAATLPIPTSLTSATSCFSVLLVTLPVPRTLVG